MPLLTACQGGILSISAPRGSATDGVLLATIPFEGDANRHEVPGELVAFDASSMRELWLSGGPDDQNFLGTLAKFCAPAIANRRVYVATFDNAVVVYGIQ